MLGREVYADMETLIAANYVLDRILNDATKIIYKKRMRKKLKQVCVSKYSVALEETVGELYRICDQGESFANLISDWVADDEPV